MIPVATTSLLRVYHKFNGGVEFINRLVGIDPLTNILGLMPHHQVNTPLVRSSGIKARAEGMATIVGGVVHTRRLHDIAPKRPVCRRVARSPIVRK